MICQIFAAPRVTAHLKADAGHTYNCNVSHTSLLQFYFTDSATLQVDSSIITLVCYKCFIKCDGCITKMYESNFKDLNSHYSSQMYLHGSKYGVFCHHYAAFGSEFCKEDGPNLFSGGDRIKYLGCKQLYFDFKDS